MIKKLLTIIVAFFLLNTIVFANSDNRSIILELKGYILTCIDTPFLFIQQNDTWREINTQLPNKGMYYIDDKYYGYGMCDVVTCQKIENPYIIEFSEYQKVGEKESPYPNNETGNKPIFKKAPLLGKFKVVINYYSDQQCTQKINFEKIVEPYRK